MFEKDAEEYAGKTYEMCSYSGLPYASDRRAREQAFQDGAEFGYNKANEWHYVKDGDLPKDEKDVQVLYQDCDKINSYTCLYDIHRESWLYYNIDEWLLEPFDYKVIAWKEIVLPKEIE